MKTAELQGALLDYHVARAEGRNWRCEWMLEKHGMRDWQAYEKSRGNPTPPYSAEWECAGPLVEKHKLSVTESHGDWFAGADGRFLATGTTPLQAICRAVVRAAFGDEVGEVGDA